MRTRLRIVNEGDIAGPKTRILLVERDGEGNETTDDLTERLRNTRIVVDLTVGEPARATLECICVGTEIDALLDELVVRHVGHSRVGRLRWRLRKWWWRVDDVTAFGDKTRQKVRR